MSKTSIPKNYHDLLGLYDTQRAIGIIKTIFQEKLCAALHLKRVTAPLFVLNGSGLNDDLNGVERPVSFDVPCLDERAEVVHSLAKWKRYALAEYGFRPGQGLVTDMNAIRRDEELDNLHSIYVDQWDWEKVITAKDRTLPFLQETVRDIVDAVCSTADELRWKFPELKAIRLTREPTFITTQELEDLYPDLTPKERENAFTRAHGTVCIMQIGGQLKSGIRHDGRAPDYDDWTLNCDILFWHKALGCALELSSMGIRVDPAAMTRQLEAAGCPERAELPFHKMLLEGKLPEEALAAIRAHNGEMTGCAPQTRFDYALRCGETITGLISAAALMRPTGYEGMEVKSIKKKMKDKAFAASVCRDSIRQCEQAGLPLDAFLSLSIAAMRDCFSQPA